jgi:hypothetical protein
MHCVEQDDARGAVELFAHVCCSLNDFVERAVPAQERGSVNCCLLPTMRSADGDRSGAEIRISGTSNALRTTRGSKEHRALPSNSSSSSTVVSGLLGLRPLLAYVV